MKQPPVLELRTPSCIFLHYGRKNTIHLTWGVHYPGEFRRLPWDHNVNRLFNTTHYKPRRVTPFHKHLQKWRIEFYLQNAKRYSMPPASAERGYVR
jgi:hypothetical protein